MSEDFYATLGVAPTASHAEVERAYRRLARASHPDLLRQASSEERGAAEERLKAINRAHHTLGDRGRRAAYERRPWHGAVGARATPTSSARAAAPNDARAMRAGVPRPGPYRSRHRIGDGPFAIDWSNVPLSSARPATDLFTVGRLLRCALLIILFALLLGLLWHPDVAPLAAPLSTPGVIATVEGYRPLSPQVTPPFNR